MQTVIRAALNESGARLSYAHTVLLIRIRIR